MRTAKADPVSACSRDMIIDSTIDGRRAMALLASRPEIDDNRIGVAGYSMGAMVALLLSGLETDLRAVVASAVPTTNQPLPIDHFNFADRAVAPVLLQIGRTDWVSSPEDGSTLKALLKHPESELRFYDSGHQLPPAFASEAASWLINRLSQ